MADVEEYFPRGGKKPATTYFKQSANFLGAPEKGEKKRKKPKKKAEGDDGYLSDEGTKEIDQSFKNCAIGLCYKTIREGLLILGRVKSVLETKVVVSLPCRMIGSIMACHISVPYNKVLEEYVNDKIDRVTELTQMFRIGQYLAVKVLEVNNLSLMLSVMPQHVNAQMTQADLQKGNLVQAAVSSVEDHGYVMDIGVPNTRAFLPKSNTNPDIELDVGMVCWCSIKTAPSAGSVVTLSNELVALQNCWLRHKTSAPLLPGSAVDFIVDTPLENGIEGHMLGDTTAYIQRQHADTVKGKKPALGQKIRARLLYVMPTRNTPFLTMRNIFESTYPDLDSEQKLKDGDIIETAQVLKITGRSIHFRLGAGSYGTMSLKRIQVDEDLTDEEVVAKSYPIGSVHKVRVLCYNLSDYVYSVSDQPDVVSERYFSFDQLRAGEIVDATVKSVADNHVLLNVGRLSGFVPQAHLSDSGIFIDPKKASTSKLPKKKFKVGQAVRARVLSVDPARQTLFLTLKPTLLNPQLELLDSYENVHIGKAYTGVIKTIRNSVLVAFFNNVHALVPRQYVTKEPLDDITQAFHIGQIVNCTILRVDPENRKMSGSFTTQPFWPAPKRVVEKRKQLPDNEVPQKKQTTDEVKDKKKQIATESEEEKEDSEQECKDTRKKKKQGNIDDLDAAQEKKATKTLQKKLANKLEKSNTEDKSVKKEKKKKNLESVQTEDLDSHEKQVSKKLKKKLEKQQTEEPSTEEDEHPVKKEKKKNKLELVQTDDLDIIEKPFSKNLKKKLAKQQAEESNTEDEEPAKEDRKRKKKVKEVVGLSEESDPIDTDNYEDTDQILSPQDLALIDLTDCTTQKQWKKRVVSLLKSVKNRTMRLNKIEGKITRIENRGLTTDSKVYHTAMHAEKIVIQERIKKLLEALGVAQEKLKEFGVEPKTEYKKKKKEREINVEEKAKGGEKENVEENKKDVEKGNVQEKRKEKLEIKVAESLEPALEAPSAKDFWSASADSLSKTVQDEESSSSEDEDKEQPKKKRKKLSVAEKLAKVRDEEERVRELERRATESESQPRSSEQFERALLANPNSSQLWIAYMAFHLQATEIEKARTIGRKALSTISFREETEKLNVWLAMINFENRFGTKESQQKTLEEALQMNDPFKIHSKLLDIYVETSKHQELAALVDLMLRKYKRQTSMYTLCGAACFKLGLVDKARQVMQKAIAVLEKKEHVSVLVQFALLERSSGARERSEALFEQVLAVYPQRVDVCAVYVDMLLKSGDLEQLRQVMERMTSQKLPARKMKILYKKWIEVEEKAGDKDQVERIKQRALQYIEKAKF